MSVIIPMYVTYIGTYMKYVIFEKGPKIVLGSLP